VAQLDSGSYCGRVAPFVSETEILVRKNYALLKLVQRAGATGLMFVECYLAHQGGKS
jgi:hypothetical protein